MRNLILETIRENQDKEIFTNTKMKHFSKRIMKVYEILTFLEANSSTKVGICGNNSSDWIAVYIATLLKGCTLVIIPPLMTKSETTHYMSITSVNYLFLDSNHSTMNNLLKNELLLALQVVFDINSLEVTIASPNVQNMLLDINVLLKETFEIDKFCLDNDHPNDIETIITPTLGTSFPEQKYVVHSSINILRFLENASKEMPFKQFDKIQNIASYSRFHLVNVLIPFIKGCVITNNTSDTNYFIESTESFEQMWKHYICPVSYGKIGSFLLSKNSWYWLYKLLILLNLKKYYKTKHLKGVIILNNETNEGIMSVLRKSFFPLFTTYGSQETNQLIATNDFSTIPLRKKNCAGIMLDDYNATIMNEELHLISSSMFNKYYADPKYSEYVIESGWYNTKDIAKIKNDILYIYGRKDSYYKKGNITLDELERLIKGLPFVQEAILFFDNNLLYLSVFLDRNFIETKGWGYIKSKNFVKNFKEIINAQIKPSIEIAQINIANNPFEKTFEGTVRKYLYRNVYEIGG